MPQRRIIKASDLSGIFIFQDPKRGTVFYDIFSRKGYILTSSDVRIYTVYSAMFPLCIVMAMLCVSMFRMSYLSAALIFLALYLVIAAGFRFGFFYKLPVAERWNPPKRESLFLYFARGDTMSRLLTLALLVFALTILMPLYALIEGYEGINFYAACLVAAVTLVFFVIVVVSMILKKKYNY